MGPQSPGTQLALLDVAICSANDTFLQKTLPFSTANHHSLGLWIRPKPITSVPKKRKRPLVFHLLLWER